MDFTYSSARYLYKLAAAGILSFAMLFTFLPSNVEAGYSHNTHQSQCIHHHKVKHGETLSDISVYHGLPLSRLAKANHIHDTDHIVTGQWLCIPEHLGHGSAKHDHKKPPTPRYCSGSHYIVQHGDTLSEIAKYYGVSLHKLAHKNHIKNVDRIRAGQKLCLPY